MAMKDSTQSDTLRLLFQNNITDTTISRDAHTDKLLHHYASLGNNSPNVIMIFSSDGEIRSRNDNETTPYKNIVNMVDFKRILLKKSYQELETAFQGARGGNAVQCEVEIKRKKQFYEILMVPIQSQGVDVEGIGLIIKDITIRKRHHMDIENENKGFKLIFDHLHIGVWVSEFKTGKLVYASKGLTNLYNYPIESFNQDKLDIRSVIQKYVHQDDKEYVRQTAIEVLANGESVNMRYRITHQDGTEKWLTCNTAPYYDDNGKITHIFGMQTDITDEVKTQEQLTFTANHDLLTTLPNQRSLDEKLDSLFLEEKPFAFAFLNLDRFSQINGSLGYHVGDKVLKTIANRLLLILPESSFVARLKSNDFIILFEDYSSNEILVSLIENLIQDIKQPITIDEYEINMTSSIGVSFYPEDGDSGKTLMEKAHSALAYSKKSGRNTFRLYSYSKDTAFQRKLRLENEMLEAMEREDFELYYQPLVETQTGEIMGAEALIRWNHKEWGLISPGEFIPIAEENHLINDISDWVIKKACAQIREWKNKGLQLIPVSVNISPIRLMKKGFTEYVKSQLEAYEVPTAYLGVEITEGSLLKNEKGVIDTLAQLKELGVRVAIDDFGTGFASLNYLREYQADTLKIDQVFIQSRDGQVEKDNIIVGSVMEMAKGLKMKIIAEGVEEYGQYRFLKNRHCDLIQGYLFSRPVPVADFEQILVKGVLEPDPEKVEKDRFRKGKSTNKENDLP
ncbi:EAL domain-containing protein [Paucisalibacillus sp. EB02]|uniref:EAL domain-containing protein n=1 Tax=Paucisalibacillus sp. EB02 TaxID=1347087 RepID=UPI0004B4AE77|nr:EAL domain-containing protein [Paucisalibacillus sp. EB02]